MYFQLFDGDGNQLDELKAIVPQRLDLGGISVKDALDRLIPRHRGLGWSVRTLEKKDPDHPENPSTVTVYINIFTVFDQDVMIGSSSLDGIIIHRNKEVIADFDVSGFEVGEITNVKTSSSAYGTIRVLGERVRMTFTLSFQDGTFEKGWTSAQEAAYKAGSNGTAEKNDTERATDKYHTVYQYYLIPSDWDWKAGNGAGGAKNNVSIVVRNNGQITWSGPPAEIRKWSSARIFEDRLPIEAEQKTDKASPEFKAPFAVLKTSLSGYDYNFMVHHPGLSFFSGAHVSLLDNHCGIQLQCSPNHLLAQGHWPEATLANTQKLPMMDYDTLVATVSCQIDERLKYIATVAPNNPDNVLTIEVPEAHLWCILPGTVLDATNGNLVKHAPDPSKLNETYPIGNVIRNDLPRAKRIAALAAVWYGRQRTPVQFQMAGIVIDLEIGNILANLKDGRESTEVHTVVSEVIFDLRRRTTSVTTAYGELDFLDR